MTDTQAERIATTMLTALEGCHQFAYPDPASPLGQKLGAKGIAQVGELGTVPSQYAGLPGDPWTIGYGATAATSPDVHRGRFWTMTQCEEALAAEVHRVSELLRRAIKRDLTAHQFAALISFTYNVGFANLADSTMLRMLNAGDIQGCAAQFERWTHAQGHVLQGLVNRRRFEREMFERK